MSLNSHWFQNGKRSKLNDQKDFRRSTKMKGFFDLSTLTACHFGTSWSSETYCTSFLRSNQFL